MTLNRQQKRLRYHNDKCTVLSSNTVRPVVVEVRTSQRGRKPKLSQEEIDQVNATLQSQPDITLGELMEQLHLNIRQSRLGRIVREKLGYLVQEEGDPRFRTGASPMCRKSEKHGNNKWKRFRQKNLFFSMKAA